MKLSLLFAPNVPDDRVTTMKLGLLFDEEAPPAS
jgi:hypothetical protein